MVRVLLEHIRALGLISDETYSKAVERVYAAAELPSFFRCPARPEKMSACGHPAGAP